MAITNLLESQDAHSEASLHAVSKQNFIYSNIIYCIINTVCFQTEFTSQAYKLKFLEPVVLLAVTHGPGGSYGPFKLFCVTLENDTEDEENR